MTCREAESLLHARLDGELDISGSANVDLHLEDCRTCAKEYAALEKLQNEIAAANLAYAPRAAFERELAEQFVPEKVSRRRKWPELLMAVAAAVVLAVAIPKPQTRSTMQGVTDAILDSHLRGLAPGHLVDVPNSDRHTVKPWFQGKTSFSPPVPDLSKDGFVLVGGRLDVIQQKSAAAIVYQLRQHVVSLYALPSTAADTKPLLREHAGYRLIHWIQSGMSYWAVSDAGEPELRMFADLIRGQ